MTKKIQILCAVGSHSKEICSIGSFARQECTSFQKQGVDAFLLEPNGNGKYPDFSQSKHKPDVILFHTPSLNERKYPWNFFKNFYQIKKAYPKAYFINVVHEYSEAPLHWKLRQKLIAKLGDGVIVNSEADYEGLKSLGRPLLKTNLGPTLYFSNLLQKNVSEKEILTEYNNARNKIADELEGFKTPSLLEKKWLLYSGLLTPGKGVDRLIQLKSILGSDVQVIAMGGIGPKQRDKDYANGVLSNLKESFGNRFHALINSTDAVFKNLLLASDLVVLPYENGVSERRSSFLSAMSCGGDVWTTIGDFSKNLSLDKSAAIIGKTSDWTNLTKALDSSAEISMKRRKLNLEWAGTRDWDKRIQDILNFINTYN